MTHSSWSSAQGLRVRERDGGCEVTYKPASDSTTHSTTGVIAKQETNVVLADTAQVAHAHALSST